MASSTPNSKPTIVLVHGSWHRPAHFEPLATYLQTYNYKTLPLSLPSTQDPNSPPKTLADDTATIRAALEEELSSSPNNIVILCHSYGGVPAINAITGLDPATRRSQNHPNAVTAIAAIAAMLPLSGETFVQAATACSALIYENADSTQPPTSTGSKTQPGDAATPPPQPLRQTLAPPHQAFAVPRDPPGASWFFYHDLPASSASHWISLLGPAQSQVVYIEPITANAAWEVQELRVSYLLCELDRALPVGVQRAVVGRLEGVRGKEAVGVESVESGHSPFLSQVQRTGEFVRRAAGEEGV
ncbi:hypothetical protein MBLNU230_g6115t1 [Neophaeotheca triangularis]